MLGIQTWKRWARLEMEGTRLREPRPKATSPVPAKVAHCSIIHDESSISSAVILGNSRAWEEIPHFEE
jgi:hypothetical protein